MRGSVFTPMYSTIVPPDRASAATFLPADIRDPSEAFDVVDEVVRLHGRIDVAVNNAGGAPPAEAATASPKFSQKIIELNLLAPLHIAQRANHHMQLGDGGSIINIASVSGHRASPGTAAYGAAKAGLLSLTKTLAMEWAPKVRVNSVTAGIVLTEQAHLYHGDEAGIAAVSATIPIGRMAMPRDIGNACLFLASDLSSYVTGADLAVHGGGEPPPFLAAASGTTK